MENLLSKHNQDDRDALSKDVRHKFQLSRDFYHTKFQMFKRLYKEYRAQRDDADDEGDWSIKVALAYGLVETIVSRISQTVLGKLTIEVKPKRDPDLRKADNFYNMCRTFFGAPQYRIDYTNATRERVICGTAWEFDEWAQEYEDGFRWVISKMEKVANMEIPVVSAVAKVARRIAFKGYSKIAHKFPIKVGYATRFPSIFNVFPQPGVVRVEDLKWVIEEVDYRSVEDLEKGNYTDDLGNLVPVYDLSEIKAAQERKVRITPTFPEDEKALASFRQELEGAPLDKTNDKDDGIDAVHLLILRTAREQIVVANGMWVVQHVKDLYHKPGLKIRARYYTPNANSIFGIGALEPVLDSINEYNDVHSLSMQDWFRSVNQMFAYDEGAFPYPDDFDPRGGGRVRAAAGTDMSRAMMPMAHRDNVGSMLTAQSGIQGSIENIVSVAEMTPGAMGTRPYHSTYGGLMEIQSTMARRFSIMMNIDQCQTMKQMDEMYWLYEQFMFEPLSFKKFNAGIGAVSYKREDIDTDGEGFLFVASDDPSFGDSQVQRNQALVLLAQSMTFGDYALRHPEEDKCSVSEVFRFVLETFGKGDSTKILLPADGSVDPDKEFELMLQGVPVMTQPKENKSWHLIKHMIQKQTLDNNQDKDPAVVARLIEHIEQTRSDISDVLNNPEQYAGQFMQEEAMKAQGSGPGPAGAPNMGQNLPAAAGAPPAPAQLGGYSA
jgi:hypothetical protein